jgi:hypothetical protein
MIFLPLSVGGEAKMRTHHMMMMLLSLLQMMKWRSPDCLRAARGQHEQRRLRARARLQPEQTVKGSCSGSDKGAKNMSD